MSDLIKVTIANRDKLRRDYNAAMAAKKADFTYYPPDTEGRGQGHSLTRGYAKHLLDYMTAIIQSNGYVDISKDTPQLATRAPSFVKGFDHEDEAQGFAAGMQFMINKLDLSDCPIKDVHVVYDYGYKVRFMDHESDPQIYPYNSI